MLFENTSFTYMYYNKQRDCNLKITILRRTGTTTLASSCMGGKNEIKGEDSQHFHSEEKKLIAVFFVHTAFQSVKKCGKLNLSRRERRQELSFPLNYNITDIF